MATTIVNAGGLYTITGLTASETSDTVGPISNAMLGSVTAVDGGGTGFNTGTLTIQGSPNNSDWVDLKNPLAAAITFTADGYNEIATSLMYFRAVADSNISDVDIIFRFI